MAFCKWLRQDNGIYRCEVCGYITKLENAYRKCGIRKPNLTTRIMNFLPALTSHLMTGSRKTTQEEMAQRLAVCKECPLFMANTCTHDSCGCNIKDTQVFLNKLYWADQKCPLDKWEAVVGSGV